MGNRIKDVRIIGNLSYHLMKFINLKINVDNAAAVVINDPKLLKPIISLEDRMIMIDLPSSQEAEEMIVIIMIDHPEVEVMTEEIMMIMTDHQEAEGTIVEMIGVLPIREVVNSNSHKEEEVLIPNVAGIEMTS